MILKSDPSLTKGALHYSNPFHSCSSFPLPHTDQPPSHSIPALIRVTTTYCEVEHYFLLVVPFQVMFGFGLFLPLSCLLFHI